MLYFFHYIESVLSVLPEL